MVLRGLTIDQKPLKDHMEAVGHKEAFYYVCDLVKEKAELKNSPLPPKVFQVLSSQHYPFLCRGFTNFKITLIQEI